MDTWATKRHENNLTGVVRTIHRKVMADANGTHVYVEVYELGGRLYWSANIRIANRPDLSRMAYGMYAAIPGALAVAKARATRLGNEALRAA